MQIIQVDQDFRTDVLKDMREAQGKIAELKERLTAAEDQLKRVDLRAPQAGIVHQLAMHTVGGVISNAETIMQIVPRADELVVEAKVAPRDIDQVATGAKAVVRIMAGNQRTQPEIKGVLTRVSADLASEPQQQNSAQPPLAYYTVRVALPLAEVTRLKDIRLLPGMPAEVFIQTHDRTPSSTCSSRCRSRLHALFASDDQVAGRRQQLRSGDRQQNLAFLPPAPPLGTRRLHQLFSRRHEGSGTLSPSPTENPRIGWSAIIITLGAVPVVVYLIEARSAPSGANLN
jgi:hypothetical protein